MKKKIAITLSTVTAIFSGLLIGLIYFLFPPDVSIGTPPEVKQITLDETLYELESVQSVQRISEFEGTRRRMKWLIITLKNKTIIDEKELSEIAEPICKGLLSNNTGYEGLDIKPNTTLRKGVDCSIWGA